MNSPVTPSLFGSTGCTKEKHQFQNTICQLLEVPSEQSTKKQLDSLSHGFDQLRDKTPRSVSLSSLTYRMANFAKTWNVSQSQLEKMDPKFGNEILSILEKCPKEHREIIFGRIIDQYGRDPLSGMMPQNGDSEVTMLEYKDWMDLHDLVRNNNPLQIQAWQTRLQTVEHLLFNNGLPNIDPHVMNWVFTSMTSLKSVGFSRYEFFNTTPEALDAIMKNAEKIGELRINIHALENAQPGHFQNFLKVLEAQHSLVIKGFGLESFDQNRQKAMLESLDNIRSLDITQLRVSTHARLLLDSLPSLRSLAFGNHTLDIEGFCPHPRFDHLEYLKIVGLPDSSYQRLSMLMAQNKSLLGLTLTPKRAKNPPTDWVNTFLESFPLLKHLSLTNTIPLSVSLPNIWSLELDLLETDEVEILQYFPNIHSLILNTHFCGEGSELGPLNALIHKLSRLPNLKHLTLYTDSEFVFPEECMKDLEPLVTRLKSLGLSRRAREVLEKRFGNIQNPYS